MKTVMYIDMLFIQGVLINYTLLLCSARFSGINVNRWRILASAIFGGLASFLIFLPTPAIIFQIIIKLLVTNILLFIAFKTNIRGYIKGFIWYIAFNCFLAGLVLLFYFTGGNGVILKNFQIYFDISAILLVIATLVLYICATAIRMVFVVPEQKPTRIEITVKEAVFNLSACYDNGFTAKDILNNAPLLLIDYNSCKASLPETVRTGYLNYHKNAQLSHGMSVLPINSIGGTELTLSLYPVSVKVEEKIVDGVKLCFTKQSIDINGTSCLLSKEFMEVLNNAQKIKV